jgi:hypothetical protein
MQRPSSHFRSLALSEHEPLFRLNVRFWQILLQKSQIARRQMASITLPRSPASLSSGDEVPHIFTRKSRLRPKEFLIASANRLLQKNRHEAAKPSRSFQRPLLARADMPGLGRYSGFDPLRKLGGPKCCDEQHGFFNDVVGCYPRLEASK